MEETNEIRMSNGMGETESLKSSRQHFSRLGLAFFGGTVVIHVSELIPALLLQYFKPELLENPNVALLSSVIPMYLVGMPVLIALTKLVPAEKVDKRGIRGGHFAVAALMTYAIMVASNLVGTVATTVIGFLKGGQVDNRVLGLVSSVNIFLLMFYAVLCAPIMEEYVFRKLIVDRTVRYGQGVAIVVSGLMFGLFHGNLTQFAYATTLGMFLAFLYVKTGNLKITIALHMAINFLSGVIGTLVLDLIDMEKLMEMLNSGFDPRSVFAFYRENGLGILMMMAYDVCVYGMVIAGGVLLIIAVAKKKFTLAQGKVFLPRGSRFRTVVLNPGMLLFCAVWIAMIIQQLLM